MPKVTTVVDPDFRFSDFLKKQLKGSYSFELIEGLFGGNVYRRGWVIKKHVPRDGSLGSILDLFSYKKVAVAVVCNIDSTKAVLEVYEKKLLEYMIDLAKQFESLYPDRSVDIREIVQTIK